MNMQSENETQPIKITKEKLLIVEGKDEVEFFKVFFNKKNIQGIQIMDSGGRDNFKKLLPVLQKNFNTLTSLAIIQDADDKPPNVRFDSICSTLTRCDLGPPNDIASFNTKATPKVGIFIIPDGESKGMLESLCLSTIESKEKETLKCVDEFMKCIEIKSKKPKNPYKAHHRAFLAAMPDDTPSLGVAAQKGYWDFDSDKLKPLLEFVEKI